MPHLYRALGFMSGTSLDGIDVALIDTDGGTYVKPLAFAYYPYDETLRTRIRACFGARTKSQMTDAAEQALTTAHITAAKTFLATHALSPAEIDLIGFHGQTITHDPDNHFTWQLGDGARLAKETGIPVVYDFRSADVAAGGQGAPLIPIYHWARVRSAQLTAPVAVLNIGGVANVTWLGQDDGDILAFDCGPGNALIDDKVLTATGQRFDTDGAIARSGTIDPDILSLWLSHPFFAQKPPKSLDREAWNTQMIARHSVPDAVATLTAFTVEAIAKATDYFPAPVTAWYVTGGGRLNTAIMTGLEAALRTQVRPVDDLGWNGDALEAEGFAYLAVRSLLGLPLPNALRNFLNRASSSFLLLGGPPHGLPPPLLPGSFQAISVSER